MPFYSLDLSLDFSSLIMKESYVLFIKFYHFVLVFATQIQN